MQLSKLVTYSFNPNVGTGDRIFRIFSGIAIAAVPWIFNLQPQALSYGLTLFGLAWFMTGIVSRCGLYYLFGKSTLGGKS